MPAFSLVSVLFFLNKRSGILKSFCESVGSLGNDRWRFYVNAVLVGVCLTGVAYL